MGTILLIIIVLMLIGAFPAWPHSRGLGIWAERRAGADIDHIARVDATGADMISCSAMLVLHA